MEEMAELDKRTKERYEKIKKSQKRDDIIMLIVTIVLGLLLFLWVLGVAISYNNAETQEEKDRIMNQIQTGMAIGLGKGIVVMPVDTGNHYADYNRGYQDGLHHSNIYGYDDSGSH
jgi:hypothetical protein